MKQVLIAFMLLAGFSASAHAQNKQEVRIKTSAVCSMCKATIEDALHFEKGVKSAYIDLETLEAVIVFNTKKTSVEKLKTAINSAGYDADESPAHSDAYKQLNACCKKEVGIH